MPLDVVTFSRKKLNPENDAPEEKLIVTFPFPFSSEELEDVIFNRSFIDLPVTSSLASNIELNVTLFAGCFVLTSNVLIVNVCVPPHLKEPLDPPSPGGPSKKPEGDAKPSIYLAK